MLDSNIRKQIDPVLDSIAGQLHRVGITANQLSVAGLLLGLGAGICVMQSAYLAGFICFCLSRLADGLDGPVARQTQITDFGGYLDIVCDFIFYSFIPFSFAIAHPEFALAACFLMLSFMGTGTSFLAYAILQAKHPETSILPSGQRKSFYYLGGLTEGAETIFVLGLCFWLPDYFAWLAWGFGILCWITVITRIQAAWLDFGKDC